MLFWYTPLNARTPPHTHTHTHTQSQTSHTHAPPVQNYRLTHFAPNVRMMRTQETRKRRKQKVKLVALVMSHPLMQRQRTLKMRWVGGGLAQLSISSANSSQLEIVVPTIGLDVKTVYIILMSRECLIHMCSLSITELTCRTIFSNHTL